MKVLRVMSSLEGSESSRSTRSSSVLSNRCLGAVPYSNLLFAGPVGTVQTSSFDGCFGV